MSAASSLGKRANAVYYFEIGLGIWRGEFRFQITSWRKFLHSGIGLKNSALAFGMYAIGKLLGSAGIFSRLEGFPNEGEAGAVSNEVRITRLGITLYLLQEKYLLHPDGRQVRVISNERFGPIPFLFNVSKDHPAEILESGMLAIYYIPLLGAEWVGRYTVQPDRNHIDAALTSPWGEAREVIHRAN
ncbi:MAG: hypothetical protein ACRD8O_23350 [Bryobacteraceae bacterium]